MSRLSGSVPLRNANNVVSQLTSPVSISSGWLTLAPVITAPTVIVIASPVGGAPPVGDTLTPTVSLFFYRQLGMGTNVRIRVVYDKNGSAVGKALTYRLWGRRDPSASLGDPGNNNDWMVLPNRSGVLLVSPTFGFTTDPQVSSVHRATNPAANDGTHDCDGCDEFFIEITQEIIMTGATDSLHRFQVKII